MDKKISFEKKLEKVRKTLNVPVIFSVGMNKANKYDILDIKVFPNEEYNEEETESISYIG